MYVIDHLILKLIWNKKCTRRENGILQKGEDPKKLGHGTSDIKTDYSM